MTSIRGQSVINLSMLAKSFRFGSRYTLAAETINTHRSVASPASPATIITIKVKGVDQLHHPALSDTLSNEMIETLVSLLRKNETKDINVSITITFTQFPSSDYVNSNFSIAPTRTGAREMSLKVTFYTAFIKGDVDFAFQLAGLYADIKWRIHILNYGSGSGYNKYLNERSLFLSRARQEILMKWGIKDGASIHTGIDPCNQRTWDNRKSMIVFTKRDVVIKDDAFEIVDKEVAGGLIKHTERELAIIRGLGINRDVVIKFRLDQSKTKRGYCTWLKCGPCFIDVYIVNPITEKISHSDIEIAKMVITHEIGHLTHFVLDDTSHMDQSNSFFEVYADAYTVWRNSMYRQTLASIRSQDHLNQVDNVAQAIGARFNSILSHKSSLLTCKIE